MDPKNGDETQQPVITPEKLKSMLNLPETASDVELIQALAGAIANLQQKYDMLLADSMTLEDKVANRDLEDYKDVITEQTADFWREQLIANRDTTIEILGGMRQKLAEKAQPAQPAPEPLKNRLDNAPTRSIADIAGDKPTNSERALAIRNRATEIRKSDKKVGWSEAFARAEKEIQ